MKDPDPHIIWSTVPVRGGWVTLPLWPPKRARVQISGNMDGKTVVVVVSRSSARRLSWLFFKWRAGMKGNCIVVER